MQGSERTFQPILIGSARFARPADLRRPRSPRQLAFNHFAKLIGARRMLALLP